VQCSESDAHFRTRKVFEEEQTYFHFEKLFVKKRVIKMAFSNVQQDAHIPTTLRDPLLVMSFADTSTGNIPTIFVGIVDNMYTNEMWTRHKSRIVHLFNITDQNCIGDVQVHSLAGNLVDGERLGQDMSAAIDEVNRTQTRVLRIVGLGIGSSLAVTEALESLICGWAIPFSEKEVQFVALGESPGCHYLNFCKSLCLKRTCKCIHYYNTMDYNAFGFLRLDIQRLMQ